MALQLLDGDRQITVKDSELADIDGGDPGTTYTVRQISPAMNRELSKKHTKYAINKHSHTRETVIDNIELMDDLLDHALIGWTGIQHRGEPVPCVREFKLLLDYPRKAALLTLAGLNQVAPEGRDESFRGAPSVL